ncbi:hypothetical protein NL676_016423 [Syzygium grande]|nr:hypothetical protein NL676_016423 [Syzygium grande]
MKGQIGDHSPDRHWLHNRCQCLVLPTCLRRGVDEPDPIRSVPFLQGLELGQPLGRRGDSPSDIGGERAKPTQTLPEPGRPPPPPHRPYAAKMRITDDSPSSGPRTATRTPLKRRWTSSFAPFFVSLVYLFFPFNKFFGRRLSSPAVSSLRSSTGSVIVTVCFSKISGGHVNPAVTFGA